MLERTPQHAIDEWMYEQTEGVVQSGPFNGMEMLPVKSWDDGALSPALLGCHEEELHEVIEKEIARLASMPNPKIVNVGCAEGYYAVGLARRLPHATVWAVDTNEESLKVAAEAAVLNGVALVTGAFVEDMFAAPDLVVMDCEGAEVWYLDHERYPGLLGATMVVEIHNSKLNDVPTQDLLLVRWRDHHHIVAYFEGPRNPNKFEMLCDKPSAFRWMAVSENRPCAMGWYVMRPKMEKRS